MRAVQFEQTHGAALIAERHEVLSQDLDPVRQIPQLVGEADRLPETAEVFAASRARADMGEFGVLLGDLAVIVDRKSTRLNSSHANISYAVFCLKKKRKNKT